MDDGAAPTGRPPLSILQRCWFVGATALGLVFLFVLPPYQGADEFKHWIRAWTVARGQIRCGAVPQAAVDARVPFRLRTNEAQLRLKSLDAALQQEPAPGTTEDYLHASCSYPPYTYAVPALVIGAVVYGDDGRIDKGDMILAFYAGRVVNWLCLCAVVYAFLCWMPAFRTLSLFFLSIPEVIEQSAVFNTDLTQFVLMFALLAALLRAPAWRQIAWIGAIALGLTLIKPIFGLYGLVAAPALVELRAREGGKPVRDALIGLGLLVGPMLLWKLWSAWSATTAGPPMYAEGVDAGQQIAFLKSHPSRLFAIFWHQFVDTFGHKLMRGSWTSILGGFGPARLELPMTGCYLLLVALALSIYGDFGAVAGAPLTPRTSNTRLGKASWVLATAGIAVAIPASVIAMYLYYTHVGAGNAHGVQGRYYLVPLFILLVLGVRLARSRWPGPKLRYLRTASWVAAIACLLADLIGIFAVADSYWAT